MWEKLTEQHIRRSFETPIDYSQTRKCRISLYSAIHVDRFMTIPIVEDFKTGQKKVFLENELKEAVEYYNGLNI